MTPWITSQLGAREHYAIPRALHEAGHLRLFLTDVWASGPWQLARSLGSPGRALAGRWHPSLPRDLVRHFPGQAIPRILPIRRARGAHLWDLYLRQFEWFGNLLCQHLPPGSFPFFGYTGAFLEPALHLQERGRTLNILGQYDPGPLEEDLVEREAQLWPGWESSYVRPPAAFAERRAREWDLAGLIIVNSSWSQDALIQQGVPPHKLRIIPLAYEAPPQAQLSIRNLRSRLRVLFLGKIILRKGIQYLFQAARDLSSAPVDFLVAGPVELSPQALASAPPNLTFLGPVPRTGVSRLYRQADVFILPTLSDGFAITQLEAMAHGLPVIATPRCGEVVLHQENGLLIPPADPAAIRDAILALLDSPGLLPHLSERAVARSRQFGLPRLSKSLLQLLSPR